MRTLLTTLCVALLPLTANSHAAEQPRHILFFGNSFTGAKDLKITAERLKELQAAANKVTIEN
ncbi:MAG: hypothetical protein GY903_14610 [Fuerstiella sp.]|nr:hypothetical protein [Fuerstiella sp.]MCP4855717.1 hypothetical protein [Fuerstiella sp.]